MAPIPHAQNRRFPGYVAQKEVLNASKNRGDLWGYRDDWPIPAFVCEAADRRHFHHSPAARRWGILDLNVTDPHPDFLYALAIGIACLVYLAVSHWWPKTKPSNAALPVAPPEDSAVLARTGWFEKAQPKRGEAGTAQPSQKAAGKDLESKKEREFVTAAPEIGEFGAHNSRLQFGSLNHAPGANVNPPSPS